MRMNNNIPALNTHRTLNMTTNDIQKSLERLSSGKRINRAADDAAGMAISQKMQAQVRGLRQASRNSLDGISLIQTAEGALNEVNAMLQRMRELCVQGANGVYAEDDLKAIGEEIVQLTEQIDKIANETEFNGIPLLKGDLRSKEEVELGGSGGTSGATTSGITKLQLQVGANENQTIIIDMKDINVKVSELKIDGSEIEFLSGKNGSFSVKTSGLTQENFGKAISIYQSAIDTVASQHC